MTTEAGEIEVIINDIITEVEKYHEVEMLKKEVEDMKQKFKILVQIVKTLYEWSDEVDSTLDRVKRDYKFLESMMNT